MKQTNADIADRILETAQDLFDLDEYLCKAGRFDLRMVISGTLANEARRLQTLAMDVDPGCLARSKLKQVAAEMRAAGISVADAMTKGAE